MADSGIGSLHLARIAMAVYLLHPFNLLSSTALSTISLQHCLLLGGLSAALSGHPCVCSTLLAGLVSLNPYAVGILGPVVAFLKHSRKTIRFGLSFIGSLGVLLWAGWYECGGSFSFLASTYHSMLTLASLRPNVGLYWYLSTEMFDFFRPFFTCFIQLHAFFYGIPIFVRFRKDPFFMTFLIIAIQGLLHPYPTASNAALYMSLIPLFSDIWSKSKILELLLIGIAFVAIQAPTMWYFWVFQGSGNANFYYAITLLYNAANVLIILDMVRWRITNQVLSLNPGIIREEDLCQK